MPVYVYCAVEQARSDPSPYFCCRVALRPRVRTMTMGQEQQARARSKKLEQRRSLQRSQAPRQYGKSQLEKLPQAPRAGKRSEAGSKNMTRHCPLGQRCTITVLLARPTRYARSLPLMLTVAVRDCTDCQSRRMLLAIILLE